eukprot:s4949_g6.t1
MGLISLITAVDTSCIHPWKWFGRERFEQSQRCCRVIDVQFDGQAQGHFWYKSCTLDMGNETLCMVDKGMTSYEVVFGKPYDCLVYVCRAGFWLLKDPHEGQCKVVQNDFSGKGGVPGQFSALRWKLFGVDKVGFGGRVVPTKRRVAGPRGVSFAAPKGPTAPSSLVDEDAEAVRQKAIEEKKEEAELSAMAGHDKPTNACPLVKLVQQDLDHLPSGHLQNLKPLLQLLEQELKALGALCDGSLEEIPPTPEAWVEELADRVEIGRLSDMGVLKELDKYYGEVTGHLTTKFVRDWRQKLYIGDGDSRMRWVRRSRYVAREFATEKRDDVFAPTTGAHSNNLLLVSFLLKLQRNRAVPTSPFLRQWILVTPFCRKITMLPEGLMVVPGTQVTKVMENFESHFGKVREQLIPCDSSIQLEDVSNELSLADAAAFRSVVGMVLYLSRDRPDISSTVKEVSSKMSKPTLTGLSRLRKLIGYFKRTGDLGVLLKCPEAGKGKRRTSHHYRSFGFWRRTAMQIGHPTRFTENQLHVAFIYSMDASCSQHPEPRELSLYPLVSQSSTALYRQ